MDGCFSAEKLCYVAVVVQVREVGVCIQALGIELALWRGTTEEPFGLLFGF